MPIYLRVSSFGTPFRIVSCSAVVLQKEGLLPTCSKVCVCVSVCVYQDFLFVIQLLDLHPEPVNALHPFYGQLNLGSLSFCTNSNIRCKLIYLNKKLLLNKSVQDFCLNLSSLESGVVFERSFCKSQ